MRRFRERARQLVTAFTILICCLAGTAAGQRLSAPRLLPESTVGFIRVANARELADRFADTAMGRITSDAQIQPLVAHLYGSLLDAFQQLEDRVGTSLDDLLAIPQGEVCLALVLPEEGQPALTLIVDVGDQLPVAEKLLQSGSDALIGSGSSRESETIGETELLTFKRTSGRRGELNMFVRGETVVLATNSELAKQLLANWEQAEDKVLADNRKFVSIMNRSRGFKDEPPQITWYLDPLSFIKHVTRGNLAGQAGLATLQGLGLDNVKALGGGIVLATEEFDSVAQSHILIGHPREGALRMLALQSGELSPEPWVPSDASSYATFHWDFQQTIDELVDLFDLFRGDGAWQAQVVDRLSDQLGVDFEEAVLASAAGRLSIVRWIEKPARVNSQSILLAFQLTDTDAFSDTLATIAEKNSSRFEPDRYRGNRYYRINFERRRRRNRPMSDLARKPEPCVAVVGDYLLVADSVKFLQEALATKSDPSKSLATELEFKLVSNKIQRLLGRTQAGGISFQRPEESFLLMYDLAKSDDVRNRLAETEQPVLRALQAALEENPLPPFSVIAQYLAPGGAMYTYDELGLHHVAFGLRR